MHPVRGFGMRRVSALFRGGSIAKGRRKAWAVRGHVAAEAGNENHVEKIKWFCYYLRRFRVHE